MTLSISVPVPPPSSSSSKRKSYKKKLPPSFRPGMYTVICGRGKHCSKSPGNKHLLQLVKYFCAPYSMAKTKSEKSDIVSKIINHIREASTCGDGIFVKAPRASNNIKDVGSTSSSPNSNSSSEWWEVDEAFAREKIGCMFRDLLHNQYQSSSKAKQARRKQADAAQQQEGNIDMNDQSIMSSSSNTMMMMPLPVCTTSSPSSPSSSSSSSSLFHAKTPTISKGGLIDTCFPTRKTMMTTPPYDLCMPSPPTAKVTPTMYGSSSFIGSALCAALASEVSESQDYQQYNATTTITDDTTTRPTTTASSLSIIQEACQLMSHDDKLVNLDNEFDNMEGGNDIFLDDLPAGEDLSTIFD